MGPGDSARRGTMDGRLGAPTRRRGATLRAADVVPIAVVALAARLAMAWAIPFASGSPDPNCAPDEAAHFAFTRSLAAGSAPTWPDRTDSIYGAFLPTPYFAHALVLAIAGARADRGRFPAVAAWARGYGAARIGGALLGVLTALALAAAAAATGSRGAGLAVGLAAALYPQLVFVGAYTNADAFTICAGALHVLALSRWATEGEGRDGLGGVGWTAGLVVTGKMSGYFLLPATACWVGWAWWRGRVDARSVLRAAAATLAIAGPVLAWNAVRNGGDVLGLGRYRRFLAETWRQPDGRHLPGAARTFLALAPRSAFGVFRNMDLLLPRHAYSVALGMLLVGVVAAAARWPRASGTGRRAAAWLLAVVLSNVALVVYNCWFVDFQPQGRYLLLSALLLTGVALLGPGAWLRGRLRWVWPAACVGWLTVTAIEAQVLVHEHPCLPPAGAPSGTVLRAQP